MSDSFLTEEEHKILKKLADSCRNNGPLNDLFDPIDEIIELIQKENKEIHFNCSKVFSIIDHANDETCLSISGSLHNVSSTSEIISTLEKKLFLYDRLLTKIETIIASIEEKKIPQKKVGKILISIVNSVFKKNNQPEPSITLKSINLEEELDEISKI